jgi:hypothetical protein
MSGVALGEGVAGNGDVPAGGFSFSDDGTCINESKESLAGVGDGVTVGDAAFSGAGVGCGFFGVASARGEGAAGRCSEMPLRPFLFVFTRADGSSNLPCTIIPETRLETA